MKIVPKESFTTLNVVWYDINNYKHCSTFVTLSAAFRYAENLIEEGRTLQYDIINTTSMHFEK